LRTIFQLFQVQ